MIKNSYKNRLNYHANFVLKTIKFSTYLNQ